MPIAKARSRSVRNGFTRSFFLAERAICLVDYSVVKCKKIFSDFEKMKADPVDVADLMLFYVEIGCRFTLAYGDIDEPFYASFARYFDKTRKYIRANNLMSVYRNRAKKIVDSVYDDVGWGFPDELLDSYNKYVTK